MKVVKNILGFIYAIYAMVIFIVTMLIVVIPIWLISLLPEPKRANALHKAFKIWMGTYMPLIFCPVFRKGKNNFKKKENYVVVINHNSLMDIPVSAPWIPGPSKTLGKIEMSKIPIFGIIYKTGALLIDRKSEASRRASYAKMEETLAMGINLCLYPEGTRNKTDKPLQPFFDGAFTMAIKSQKAIIPGIIFNTKKILSQEKNLRAWPSKIHIHFLEPISTKGLTLNDVESLKQKTHKIMESYYVNNVNTKL